jgi:hypothetical protein
MGTATTTTAAPMTAAIGSTMPDNWPYRNDLILP